jgi:MoxR-like ATPase
MKKEKSMSEPDAAQIFEAIKHEMQKAIVGIDRVIEEILVCLFTGGHVLLEGVPGTAKTLLAKTLAVIVRGDFRRVQFTPDLMPSDIVGTHIYDMQAKEFRLQKGPIFTNFLLADEINRTPPKTQSALLEAMEERQVTIEGDTMPLPLPFMVLATQNPLEFEGTYPLPEAQLDRFLMKILIPYPDFNNEREIVRKHHLGFDPSKLGEIGIAEVPLEKREELQRKIAQVTVSDPMIDYITEIVHATRRSGSLTMGASPRGSIQMMRSSKTLAAMKGRDYVSPDDVKAMACPILRHRVILKPEMEIEGLSADDIIRNILGQVNVPR